DCASRPPRHQYPELMAVMHTAATQDRRRLRSKHANAGGPACADIAVLEDRIAVNNFNRIQIVPTKRQAPYHHSIRLDAYGRALAAFYHDVIHRTIRHDLHRPCQDYRLPVAARSNDNATVGRSRLYRLFDGGELAGLPVPDIDDRGRRRGGRS